MHAWGEGDSAGTSFSLNTRPHRPRLLCTAPLSIQVSDPPWRSIVESRKLARRAALCRLQPARTENERDLRTKLRMFSVRSSLLELAPRSGACSKVLLSGVMTNPADPMDRGLLAIEAGTTLHLLHTARSDQRLTPEGTLLKTSTPKAPSVSLPQSECESPPIVGLVQERRVVTDHQIEQHRELCSGEFFDCVAARGALELRRG